MLTAALLVAPVMAADLPIEAAPGNVEPKIYLIYKGVDIGIDNWFPGGSTPEKSQNPTPKEFREGAYAFTGEQIGMFVIVRDLNGDDDISYLKVTVDGLTEALCTDVTGYVCGGSGGIYGDFSDSIPGGVNCGELESTDKAYFCLLTVEPSWYGPRSVNLEAYDQEGAHSTMRLAESWFFNPAIILDVSTNDGAPSVWFEEGLPGEMVYSGNKLLITDLSEGGVDLRIWISVDDLTDPTNSGAKCPISNVLDVERYMEYRGFNNGMLGRWESVSNPDPTDDCGFWAGETCEGAKDIVVEGDTKHQIIGPEDTAEVEFRLTYPVPCIGDFTEGFIHVIARAV